MRKTTKVISLLLTLAMMLTMALPMSAQAASFSDVPSGHHYYDAITNLVAEGILEGFPDGTFKPGDPVTRAQFTKIICYALSVGTLTYSEEERSIFSDLAPEHWAANNIVTAYKQGIINGMGDGTFAPEAGVQYEQAVKMVVCALGYSQTRADALGGYPGGYMSLANSAKILDGINDAKMYEVMNRGAVAQLIDNMLDADQIQDGQPSGSIREEVSTSKSAQGQIVAGYGVALYSGDAELDACRKNEIIVQAGSARMYFDVENLSGFDIYNYLGRSVTVYYEDESGVSVDPVTSIAMQPRKNETVKIDIDLIEDYDSSSIEYYTDADRTETETVNYSSSSDNLLNGQPVTDDLKTILDNNITNSGYITLVSSQTNSAADVAFVKTYETIVVKSVDTKTYKVYGKNAHTTGYTYTLDTTDRNRDVSITLNGNNYALSSIRENHIISISASAGGEVIEVLVSTTTASGTIESMTTSTPQQLKLNTGNKIYTVSSSVYGDGTLTTGTYVTIGLDAFGKVARFVVAAEAAYNYGYISALEHGTMTKPEVQVMLYKPAASNSTLKGTAYKLANKVKIDGTTYNMDDDGDMDLIVSALAASAAVANAGFASEIAPSNAQYAQPIRYTLDKANQINAILTNATTGDPATSLNIVNKTSTAITCKVKGSTFDQYRISSSTPVIYVPQDRASGEYVSRTNSFFDKDKSYYVQFANVSGTNVVACVYLYGVAGGSGSITATITEENKPMIVKKITEVSYEDGIRKQFILVDVTTGDPVECYEDTISLASLAVGDVIRVAIGTDDYVEAFDILADAEEVAAGTFDYSTGVYEKTDGSGTGINAEFRVLIGTAQSKVENTFVIVPGYSGSADASLGETYTATESLPVYKIDTAASVEYIVDTSTVDEVVGYNYQQDNASTIMVYTVEGLIKALIIFE